MFSNCNAKGFNVSTWDTANLENVKEMFLCSGTPYASYLVELRMDNWKFDKITNADSMLSGCNRLRAIYAPAGTNWESLGISGTNMFAGCSQLNNVPKSGYGISGANNTDPTTGYFYSTSIEYPLYYKCSMVNTTSWHPGFNADTLYEYTPAIGETSGHYAGAYWKLTFTNDPPDLDD
jgi:hypothetical protein